MATANPYDRREQEKNRGRGRHDFPLMGEMVEARFTPPQILTFEDLNALALSVHSRGRQETIDHLEPLHREAERAGRRQAWSEGHASGKGDGAAALVLAIGEQFEALAVELHTDLAAALADEKTGSEVLRSLASRSARLVSQMIEAHHRGFEPEPPF